MANRGNFQRVQKTRGAFIPEYKVKKKAFDDHFHVYMKQLQDEEEAHGCNLVKEMTKAVAKGTM